MYECGPDCDGSCGGVCCSKVRKKKGEVKHERTKKGIIFCMYMYMYIVICVYVICVFLQFLTTKFEKIYFCVLLSFPSIPSFYF